MRTSSGRWPVLSDWEKRLIRRKASNSMVTCSEIKANLNLNVSAETVRRVISKCKYIVRHKMKKESLFTSKHRNLLPKTKQKGLEMGWLFNFLLLSIFLFLGFICWYKKIQLRWARWLLKLLARFAKGKLRFTRHFFKNIFQKIIGERIIMWSSVESINLKLAF